MDAIPRSHLAAALLLVVLAGLVGSRMSRDAAPRAVPPRPQLRMDAGGSGGRVVVHVAGAVHRPGVYRMRAGARVDDAVRRAGGATRRADLSAVNLAGELDDGRQVLVPVRSRPGVVTSSSAGGATAPQAPINLNQATLEQLDSLEGIGPTTAQKILDWRVAHGGFSNVEELGRIPGIGEKRLATLRARVTV